MAIVFNDIPNNILTVGTYVEITPQASLGDPAHRILLIGTRLASGSVPANTPKLITAADQGQAFFGKGSMLDWMIEKAKNANAHAWAE